MPLLHNLSYYTTTYSVKFNSAPTFLAPQVTVDSGVCGVCGVLAPPLVALDIVSVLGLVSRLPVRDALLPQSPVTVETVQSVSTCIVTKNFLYQVDLQ